MTKKVKPERTLRILARGQGYTLARIIVTTRKSKGDVKVESDDYLFQAIASDWGRAAHVLKLTRNTEECRAVNTGDRDHPGTCECKGFLQYGKCRHVEALQALIAKGGLR